MILSNKKIIQSFFSFKLTDWVEFIAISQQDNSNVAPRPSLNHVSLEVKMQSLEPGHGRCDVLALQVYIFYAVCFERLATSI